jgi:hypothetical protein
MSKDHPQEVLIDHLYGDYCRPSTYPRGGYRWCLQFLPSVTFDDDEATTLHPYDFFRRFVRSRLERLREPDDDAGHLQHALFPNLVLSFVQAAQQRRWTTEFGKMLGEITGGDVNIVYTHQENSHLKQFGPNKWLFCLTCVFRWAIDILVKGPNCLMTDTTFRSVHPYTLPILHAIVANESIPIAFGISPTETWLSYHRIYHHITHAHMNLNFSLCPAALAALGPNPRPGDGVAPFPDDPESVNDGDDRPEDEYSGPIDEENTSPMNRPEIEGVRELLQSIPILTDQGSALKKFIGKWGSKWKTCHRHVIESLGSTLASVNEGGGFSGCLMAQTGNERSWWFARRWNNANQSDLLSIAGRASRGRHPSPRG